MEAEGKKRKGREKKCQDLESHGHQKLKKNLSRNKNIVLWKNLKTFPAKVVY